MRTTRWQLLRERTNRRLRGKAGDIISMWISDEIWVRFHRTWRNARKFATHRDWFSMCSTFFCGFFFPVDRYFRFYGGADGCERLVCASQTKIRKKKFSCLNINRKQKQNNDNHSQYFLTAYHMKAIIQSAFQSLQQIEISVLSFSFTSAPCRAVVHGVESVCVCVSCGCWAKRAHIPLCSNNRIFIPSNYFCFIK